MAHFGLSTLPCKEAAFGGAADILSDNQNRPVLTIFGPNRTVECDGTIPTTRPFGNPRYQTLATEKPCPAHGQITSLAAKTTDLAAPRTNVQHPKRATAKKRLGEPLWELLSSPLCLGH